MSFTRTAKAVVVSCSLAGSDQITVDLTVTFYKVQARVLESQYKDDVYMVKVVKPEGIGDLIDEENSYGARKVLFRFDGRHRDGHRTRSGDCGSRVDRQLTPSTSSLVISCPSKLSLGEPLISLASASSSLG